MMHTTLVARSLLFTLVGLLVGRTSIGQELVWEMSSPREYWRVALNFGDLDHDGTGDVLMIYPFGAAVGGPFQIRSGANGSLLASFSSGLVGGQPLYFDGVGDFDLDGYPDFCYSTFEPALGWAKVQVFSPHLGQSLLVLTGPVNPLFGGRVAGGVDLDGDGLPDLAVLSTAATQGALQAFDHYGNLLYTVSAAPMLARLWDVVGLPDLDGDGANELLVGGIEYNLGYPRGFLAVVSGRTGAIRRLTFDRAVGDRIGQPIAAVGDFDGDGIPDYATGNYWGVSPRQLLTVYSSATGAIVKDLVRSPPAGLMANQIIGGHDIDLDGRPDLIGSALDYPIDFYHWGRVNAFSSRDDQLLMHWEPTVPVSQETYADLADLGVAPGSPYPLVALSFFYTNGGPSYLQVWRCAPAGSTLTGTACSSGAMLPTANLRRIDTPAGERARVVLGSAVPGALAVCVVAGANETSSGGIGVPSPLDAVGLSGCTLQVPPALWQAVVVGSSGLDAGYAGIDVPYRIDPTGFGAALQWLVLDPTTGAYGATPRCEVHIR